MSETKTHPEMVSDILKMSFEGSLEFRQRKAGEHSNDKRNGDAVAIFRKLIDTLPQCLLPDLERAGNLIVHDDEASPRNNETMQEMLRSVGFSYWPDDASTFIRDFIARIVQ